jgi:hypothetical protein
MSLVKTWIEMESILWMSFTTPSDPQSYSIIVQHCMRRASSIRSKVQAKCKRDGLQSDHKRCVVTAWIEMKLIADEF